MSVISDLPERVQEIIDQDPDDAAAQIESPPESLLVTGAAIAAGVATRKGLKAVWKRVAGVEPPDSPTKAGVTWRDALIWGAAVGAAVGVARVIGQRTTHVATRRVLERRRG
ncbi:DUF4235 domain-containing protein [Botrimarina sp.]|uniref:DUF4235 domain-containing protein n=1 Tax=Botrimarina sp. TaxID=2795802 RepID=UPI0032ECBAAC